MRYSHIIWDFNGTILDDVQTCIDCVNTMLKKRGLKEIPDKKYYHKIFGFPVKDYYARLGFDFEKEDYHTLAVEWVDLYMKKSKKAPLNYGVLETLEYFKKQGVAQYILSATELSMLKYQLKKLKIEEYFEEVVGLDNIHAGSKTALGIELMNKLKPEKALLIGDTTHDYETAQKMGIECVLYSGGHMSRETLEKCGTRIIRSF